LSIIGDGWTLQGLLRLFRPDCIRRHSVQLNRRRQHQAAPGPEPDPRKIALALGNGHFLPVPEVPEILQAGQNAGKF